MGLIEHADGPLRPKPRVESDLQEAIVSTWDGSVVRRDLRILWRVVCPCHCGGDFAIAVVPSWDAALEIALYHGEGFHG